MAITPEQIKLVRSSWNKVLPIADTAAELFYKRLFETDPKLKPLFPEDMFVQKKKLIGALARIVVSPEKPDVLAPIVQALGERNVGYGGKERDYQTVGAALLGTLEKGLGEHWNREIKAAWTEAYTALGGIMTEAARNVKQAA